MFLVLVAAFISSLVATSFGDISLVPNPNAALSLAPRSPTLRVVEDLQPKPYEFGFDIVDGLGMNQHRREVADSTGAVKGSYGYVDPLGVKRVVEYTADNDGYKAVIKSNEPGMVGQNSANAVYIVQSPPAAVLSQGLKPVLPKYFV